MIPARAMFVQRKSGRNRSCGTGGHKGRPYEKAGSEFVGVAFMAARLPASDAQCVPLRVRCKSSSACFMSAAWYQRRHEGMPPCGLRRTQKTTSRFREAVL